MGEYERENAKHLHLQFMGEEACQLDALARAQLGMSTNTGNNSHLNRWPVTPVTFGGA